MEATTGPGVGASQPPACDLLIFVATETELEQLKRAATELGLQFSPGTGTLGTFYNLGEVGTNRVLVVKTSMGPLTFKGSASCAIYYLAATQATGVIGIGMAFGVDRTTQNFGDLLVATGILPYDHNRRVYRGEDGVQSVDYSRVKKYSSKASLLALLSRRASDPEWKGKVHRGLLLSGGARIQCRSYRDELVRGCDAGHGAPIVGGDMEGVGFLSTSERSDPRWIVVKGICDFADEKRDAEIEMMRPIACYNSAYFVLSALQNTEETHG